LFVCPDPKRAYKLHQILRRNQDAHTADQNYNSAPVSRQAVAFICRKQTHLRKIMDY